MARFRVAFAALAALSLRERAGAGADAAVAAGCADARRGRRWAGADDQLGDGKLVIFPLVVSNMNLKKSISYMGYIILPIDELHHFSRWFFNHQPVHILVFFVVSCWMEFNQKLGRFSSKTQELHQEQA